MSITTTQGAGAVTEVLANTETTVANGEDRNSSRRANTIDAHVGQRVRLRRMLLGMSQERLGDQLGLTFQQVQKYEKGVNRIGASRLFDLAHVLGVTIQYFYEDLPASLGGAETYAPGLNDPGASYVADVLATREGLELNKAFARIQDPRLRRSVVDLVRSIAGETPSQLPSE